MKSKWCVSYAGQPIPSDSRRIILSLLMLLLPSLPGIADQEGEKENVFELDPFPVVGTRIRGIDLQSTLPVIRIDSDLLDSTGYSKADDMLRNLPLMADWTNDGYYHELGEPGQGLSTINMRGMGNSANLILVNGLRIAPSDGVGEVNSPYNAGGIPSSAIEAVEVLSDGASAIYGSDAISGVVNFRTVRYYRGTKLALKLGEFEGTQSGEVAVELMHGSALGSKGNVVVSLDYYERNNLPMRDYEYSATLNHLDKGGFNFSSGSDNPGSFQLDSSGPWLTFPESTDNPTIEGLIEWPIPVSMNDGGYDYAAVQDFHADVRTTGLYVHTDYKFRENFKGYLDVFYNEKWSRALLAPTPYSNWGLIAMPATNPFNPYGISRSDGGEPAELPVFDGRLVNAGPRVFEVNIDTPRIVAGLEGDFLDDWTWKIAGIWSKSTSERVRSNVHRSDRFIEAVNGVDLDGNGSLERDEFLNPFGLNSQELLEYMRTSTSDDGRYVMWMLDAHASGTLIQSRQYSLKSAVGIEFRWEELTTSFDPQNEEGLLLSGEGPQTGLHGSRHSAAAYGELRLDYLDRLVLQLAGRHEEYNDMGDIFTPKISASLRLLPELLIRGSYGEGFFAPQLGFLYRPVFTFHTSSSWLRDPKRDNETLNYGYNLVTGGNKDLAAGTSLNRSAGLVLEPFSRLGKKGGLWKQLSRLTMGADIVSIDYKDQPSFPDRQWLIDNEDKLEDLYPGQEVRVIRQPPQAGDPLAVGRIVEIRQLWTNLFRSSYEGVDYWLEWPISLGDYGNLKLRWDGTWIKSLKYGRRFQSVGSSWEPVWRWAAQVAWSRENWSTSWYFQNIGGVSKDPFYPEYPVAGNCFRINAQVSYSGLWESRITFGVRNLMDEDPPFHFASRYGALPRHPKEKRFWYLRLERNF